MAKAESMFKLSGTFDGTTHVQSRAYGYHIRRKRGSLKPAFCNDVLTKNADLSKSVTATGKVLLQCFREMGGTFLQKDLWQMMMKRMYKTKSPRLPDHLVSLEGLELNSRYGWEKRFRSIPEFAIQQKGEKLTLKYDLPHQPEFSNRITPDSYYVEVYMTWMDPKLKKCEGDMKSTGWLNLAGNKSQLQFTFIRPKWAKFCLPVLKLRAGNRQVEIRNLEGEAMRVMKLIS